MMARNPIRRTARADRPAAADASKFNTAIMRRRAHSAATSVMGSRCVGGTMRSNADSERQCLRLLGVLNS
jgi:hypothetical protein